MARFRTQTNARRAEVDIVGVAFIVQPRREQSHDMHARQAAILGQILDDGMIASVLRDQFGQFRDHVPQLVDLTLSRNMARDAARVLDVLVPVEHLPKSFRNNLSVPAPARLLLPPGPRQDGPYPAPARKWLERSAWPANVN